MTTTYLGLDEKERVKGVVRSTCRGGEEEEGIVRVRGRRSAEAPQLDYDKDIIPPRLRFLLSDRGFRN